VRTGLAIALALSLLLAAWDASTSRAQTTTWEQWQHLEGIVDVGGARNDGNLVVMAAGRLFLVSASGSIAPFANGGDGFVGSPDAEPYFVVAPVLTSQPAGAQPAGCSFTPDELFVLDLGFPTGVVRVDAGGHASHFATIPNVDMLDGIAFDTTGRFGDSLIVAGEREGATTVVTIDCRGRVTTVTDTAPPFEGGLAVAPLGFEPYGGDLIGADELTGQIWAIAPDGSATLVAVPNLPTGGDTGVESLGFVPPGFISAGGFVYLADRGTPDNPFPGTDSLLRLSAQTLSAAGVQDGDLLVATEGGGLTVAVRCTATACTTLRVADGPPGAHGEGRIAFVIPAAAAGR
jgi:hypothetical protein